MVHETDEEQESEPDNNEATSDPIRDNLRGEEFFQ